MPFASANRAPVTRPVAGANAGIPEGGSGSHVPFGRTRS